MTEGAEFMDALPDRLHEIVLRHARDTPDAPAISDPDRSVTYGQLGAAVERVAERLRAHGLRSGDRVSLINENAVAAAVLVYAISRCGAVVSPVNARIAPREVVVMRELLRPRFSVFVAASAAARAHADALPGVETVHDAEIGDYAIGPVDDGATPEADPVPALVMFTSGTTGRPKGVVHSHRAIIYQGASQAVSRRVGSDDALYIVAPLSHAIGLGSNLVTAAVAGAEALLAPRFDPAALARDIAGERISFMVAVPQVYAKLLDHAEAEGIALGSGRMRFTGTGGAPVDVALMRRMRATFGLPFGNAYGCTEMTPITRVPDGVEAAGDAIGLPAPGCEVRIVGGDGTDVADGSVGEIWARGPSRMLGYYRDPEATAETIVEGGWLRTGDMARRGAEGQIHIVGRGKELIIRSGFNVYPVEVEAVLNGFPGVVQSAVLGRKVEGDEEVVAFVQPAAGASIDLEALRAWARENLSGYKVPSEITLRELPIGPTGKILKSALA